MKRIYLDNNATTILDPRVAAAILADLCGPPSNPSAAHFFGQEARARLTKARDSIAAFLHAKPHEIIFTSGGTESMNMLIRGSFLGSGHIITSNIEHSCVYNTLKVLQEKGADVSYLPADLYGAVKPDAVRKALRPDTKFIVLGAVNSETGVMADIPAIAAIAQEAKVPFFVDGVAWLGKEKFHIHEGISGIGFSAHKFHGPKGVGFAFVRSGVKLSPLMTGGDQEYSKRPGTENLSGILGLEAAIAVLEYALPSATLHMQALRDRLENGLRERIGNIVINGTGPRIANTANISFPDTDGETLLMNLDIAGISASHGSACSSGALEPSRVLMNMGVPHSLSRSAVRFSLSRFTAEAEIDMAITIISDVVSRLKKLT